MARSESVDRLMLPGVGEIEWTFTVEIEEESWTAPVRYSWPSKDPTYSLATAIRVTVPGATDDRRGIETAQRLYEGLDQLVRRSADGGVKVHSAQPFTVTANMSDTTYELSGRYRCRNEVSATQVMTALATMKRKVLDVQR